MDAVAIIPARLESSRLPRKLLLADTGRPLLQYAWEAAQQATRLTDVIVATDSSEIAEVVAGFGGRCEMTGQHPSGTDRVAEVVRRCCPDVPICVNLQGDEPELDPEHIDQLVATLQSESQADMATLATPITSRRDLEDSSCTKVVCDPTGRALYFSRSPIPFVRDADPDQLLSTDNPWLLHLGIYAFRGPFLLKLASAAPSRLEQLEKLEQLRALEMGATLMVSQVEHAALGIDTTDDYAAFVARQQSC